jgi:hypothetical protein
MQLLHFIQETWTSVNFGIKSGPRTNTPWTPRNNCITLCDICSWRPNKHFQAYMSKTDLLLLSFSTPVHFSLSVSSTVKPFHPSVSHIGAFLEAQHILITSHSSSPLTILSSIPWMCNPNLNTCHCLCCWHSGLSHHHFILWLLTIALELASLFHPCLPI